MSPSDRCDLSLFGRDLTRLVLKGGEEGRSGFTLEKLCLVRILLLAVVVSVSVFFGFIDQVSFLKL